MNKNARLVYDVLTGKKKWPKISLKNFTQAHWRVEDHDQFARKRITNPNFCGTPGCVGGHARFLMGGAPSGDTISESAVAAWLGLTEEWGQALFYPDGGWTTPVWAGIKQDPYSLKGVAGAKLAARALKQACKLSYDERQK